MSEQQPRKRGGTGVIVGTVEAIMRVDVGSKAVWTIRVYTGRYRDREQYAQFQTWDAPGEDVRKGAEVEAQVRLSARCGKDGRWWVDVTATELTLLAKTQAPAPQAAAPRQGTETDDPATRYPPARSMDPLPKTPPGQPATPASGDGAAAAFTDEEQAGDEIPF